MSSTDDARAVDASRPGSAGRAASGPAPAGDAAFRMGCVVMASGKGRRFGSQKLLAPLAGATVLEWTLRSLSGSAVDAVVVTRTRDIARVCEKARIACAEHDGACKSDTIRVGLEALRSCSACMFLPADQPLVTGETMCRLEREACAHPGKVVRLTWRGKPASPVVFPAALFDELRALEGDRGGSAVLKAHPELMGQMRRVEALHEWETWDIDTPEDLARVEDVLRSR